MIYRFKKTFIGVGGREYISNPKLSFPEHVKIRPARKPKTHPPEPLPSSFLEHVQPDMFQILPVVKAAHAQSTGCFHPAPVFTQQPFFHQPVNIAAHYSQHADSPGHIHITRRHAAAHGLPSSKNPLHIQPPPVQGQGARTLADHPKTDTVAVQILARGGSTAAEPCRDGGCLHKCATRLRVRLAGPGIRSAAADFDMFRV